MIVEQTESIGMEQYGFAMKETSMQNGGKRIGQAKTGKLTYHFKKYKIC